MCFEDDVTNRLEEAITVFDNVCNSKWFETTPIILLLNKKDLFHEKIVEKRIPLSKCFKDFDGEEGDYESAWRFIENEFVKRNTTEKSIFPHLVCATGEEDEVAKVFQSMRNIIQDAEKADQATRMN